MRGYAVIVVNEKEVNNSGFVEREGASLDSDNLQAAFCSKLGFKWINQSHSRDLKKSQWLHEPRDIDLQRLERCKCLTCKIQKLDHTGSDAFLFVISSHGKEENGRQLIRFSDGGKIYLDDLIDSFSDEKCPSLKNVPRILIMQVCRTNRNLPKEERDDCGVWIQVEKLHLEDVGDEQLSDAQLSDEQHSDAQHSDAQHGDAQLSHAQRDDDQHGDAQHSDGQHSDGQHGHEQHGDGQHGHEQHSDAQLSDEQHSDAQHSDAQHSDAQLSHAQRDDDQHGDAQHGDAQQSDGQHSDGQHGHEQHGDGQHGHEQHSDAQQDDAQQDDGQQDDGQHSDAQQDDGQQDDGQQGDGQHGDEQVDDSSSESSSEGSDVDDDDDDFECPRKLPNNFLIVYPTSSGRKSKRNTKKGSWLIDELCDVINKHNFESQPNMNFLEVLTKTAGKIAKRETKKHPGYKNNTCIVHKLVQPLIFSDQKVLDETGPSDNPAF